MAAADLNEGGHVDLATANFVSDDAAVLLNPGRRDFATAARLPAGN